MTIGNDPLARHALLLSALLGAIAACAYAPAMGGGYIFDDRLLIPQNPYVHSFSWWPRWFTTDFWDVGQTTVSTEYRLTYYRPLVTVSYAVDWALGGGLPDLFHVSNLGWHAAACILAFYALRRWIGLSLPALLAALLLAVHPTRAESVAWISGRPDPMCCTFLLLAAAGMARRFRGQKGGAPLEILGTLGAYLSKETAIVLPGFAALEAWVALGRPPLGAPVAAKLTRAALPQAALAAGYLALRTVVFPLDRGLATDGELWALHNRPGLVLETLGRAAELVFVPHDLHVQRGLFQYDAGGKLLFSHPHVVAGVAATFALVTLVFWCRRVAPAVSLGLLLFALAFAPTSNLKPTGLMSAVSERFLYIPLMGFGLATAAVFARTLRSWRSLSFVSVGIFACLGAFASLGRAAQYSDERAYWTQELAVNPLSVEAMLHEIDVLLEERKHDEAFRLFQRAHAASARLRDPRLELRLLSKEIDALLLLAPDSDRTELENISAFLQQLTDGSLGEVRLDSRRARLVVTVNPGVREVLRRRRPLLSVARAQVLSRLGYDNEALRLIRSAVKLCPTCRSILAQAPLIHAAAGDYAGAMDIMTRYERVTGESRGIDLVRARVMEAQHWHAARTRATSTAAAVHARAKELGSLGLFGRAFDELLPHESDFVRLREVGLGYADLAFRAGRNDVARRVLRLHLSEPDAAATIAEWTAAAERH